MIRRPVRVAALACLATLAGLAAAGCARAEMPDSDPRAVAIADRVMAALGGKARWEALRGLRWTFESVANDTVRGSRTHAWDKYQGWQRVEGVTRGGDRFCFITRLDGGAPPRAWMNGGAIAGDSLAKLAARSKSLWTNDSYWFLMPYKLRDPGVRLALAPDTTIGGVTYHRLALSFEQVGETPGDRYWVYVNPANDRVERWEYILQGQSPPAVAWTWEGWEQHGGLWFPTAHRQPGRAILTRAVATVDAFPPGTFEAP